MILGICVRELIQMIVGLLQELNYGIIDINLLNFMFVHYVLIWPLLGRFYYINQCMIFNYSFLTQKVFPNFSQFDNNLDFKSQNYTEKRSTYQSKIIFFPLFSLFFICIALTFNKYTECYLLAFNMLYKPLLDKQCGNILSQLALDILSVIKLTVDFLEITFLFTLAYKILKYPLKVDKFRLKTEIVFLFLIWFVFHHIHHSLIIFDLLEYEANRNLYINMVEDTCYVGLFIYLNYQRSKVDIQQFYNVLKNFDLFIQNPICFNYLKNYIKQTNVEEYYSLFLFIDLSLYKKTFNKNDLETNKRSARTIYSNYFNDSTTSSTRKTKTNKTTFNNSTGAVSIKEMYFDIPCEIKENLDDIFKIDFELTNQELYEIYDSTLLNINNKLFNRYLNMILDEEQNKNLEKLICYFDFDFTDCENIFME